MSRWLSLPTSLRDIDAELKAREPKDELPEHLAHLGWATEAEHEEFRALVAAGGSAASVEGRGAVLQRRWLRRRASGCLKPGYWIVETREVVAGNLSCVAGADGCSCADAVVDGDGEVSSRTLWRAHLDTFKSAVDVTADELSVDADADVEVYASPLVGTVVSGSAFEFEDVPMEVVSSSGGPRVARGSIAGAARRAESFDELSIALTGKRPEPTPPRGVITL